LITNAVRYGHGEVHLDISSNATVVHVAVRDANPALPAKPPAAAELATGGRGLLILASITRHWGIVEHTHPPGKTVWFDVPLGVALSGTSPETQTGSWG
jgi:signal transduction histidine kinase